MFLVTIFSFFFSSLSVLIYYYYMLIILFGRILKHKGRRARWPLLVGKDVSKKIFLFRRQFLTARVQVRCRTSGFSVRPDTADCCLGFPLCFVSYQGNFPLS